jgi:L-amino acid N-acyltransferase YncA
LLNTSDLEAFRRIRLVSLSAPPAAFGSSVEDWQAMSDDEWRDRLSDNSVFVAFVQEEPVGMMAMIPHRGAKAAHRANVAMVYLSENLRGQGISKKAARHR